jgi:hypothetical protein
MLCKECPDVINCSYEYNCKACVESNYGRRDGYNRTCTICINYSEFEMEPEKRLETGCGHD